MYNTALKINKKKKKPCRRTILYSVHLAVSFLAFWTPKNRDVKLVKFCQVISVFTWLNNECQI